MVYVPGMIRRIVKTAVSMENWPVNGIKKYYLAFMESPGRPSSPLFLE
jgi:hypothetical protein